MGPQPLVALPPARAIMREAGGSHAHLDSSRPSRAPRRRAGRRFAGRAQTGPYPNKPIRMIVPLAAGSAVDNAARIVVQKMGQNMGQSIVIENQPGAAGLIGAGAVAKAAPDGYTLGGFNDSIMTMLPNLHPKMPWDILKDFEPVSLVATVSGAWW